MSAPVAPGPTDDLWALIGDCLPNDHARQVQAPWLVRHVLREGPTGRAVLDVGCGDGRSVDLFREVDRDVRWHGLDIEVSPEVATRKRTDASFHAYDGRNIPFSDHSFDVVYSNQVFEHVRHPDAVLAEVSRVLKPGGAFIGSVSALEPYHSLSFWSFTPYGWYVMLKDAGLRPVQFRPGIDGPALIRRSYLRRPPEARTWFESSPLNEEMDAWGTSSGRRPALINLRKVQYCGHLVFWAQRL